MTMMVMVVAAGGMWSTSLNQSGPCCRLRSKGRGGEDGREGINNNEKWICVCGCEVSWAEEEGMFILMGVKDAVLLRASE